MKMKKSSRILTLLLALLMILTCFAGCASSQDMEDDLDGSYVEEQETAGDDGGNDVFSWDSSEHTQFRKQSYLEEHYQKHVIDQEEFVDDFGDITIEEYLMLAQWLIDFPDENVLMKYEEDGDQLFYNTEYNFFGVLSKDGYIRTFFRPSAGQEYFDRQ